MSPSFGGHIGRAMAFGASTTIITTCQASARLDYQVTENANLTGTFHFINTRVGLFNNNNFASVPDPNARQATTQ